MTRNISKEAAAQRLYKLAAVARVIQRAKSAGCCGRKRSSGKRRKVKRSSLNKEASRDLMRKIACAVAVIQRTRGLQKTAGDTPIYKNPLFIGGAGGGLIGGTLGAILGPKGQKFLSGLAGFGIGTAAGVGAGYGYTKLKKKPKEEEKKEPTFEEQHGGKTPEEVAADEDFIQSVNEGLAEDAKAKYGPVAPVSSGAIGSSNLLGGSVPVTGYKSPNMSSEQARILASPQIPDSIQLPDDDLDLFNQCKTEQGRIDVLTGLYKDMAPKDVMKYAQNPDLFNREKPMLDLGYYAKDSRYAH